MIYLIIVIAFNQFFIVILIFIFVNYNLQGPIKNCQGEWIPWINIIIITSNSQWEGKFSRVNLTIIFESAIIAELDTGVYVCGHGKLTLTFNTTSSEQALVFL